MDFVPALKDEVGEVLFERLVNFQMGRMPINEHGILFFGSEHLPFFGSSEWQYDCEEQLAQIERFIYEAVLATENQAAELVRHLHVSPNNPEAAAKAARGMVERILTGDPMYWPYLPPPYGRNFQNTCVTLGLLCTVVALNGSIGETLGIDPRMHTGTFVFAVTTEQWLHDGEQGKRLTKVEGASIERYDSSTLMLECRKTS